MVLRLATEQDLPAIKAALNRTLLISDSAAKYGASEEVALREIRSAMDNHLAYVQDGVFILFQLGCLWYSDEPVLFEQLVMRIDEQRGSLFSIIESFDVVAKSLGARHIVVGDSQQLAMLPRYEAMGYTLAATQMYKGVS